VLIKTRGIVLNTTDYNDNYSLIHIYTETYGKVTYILPKSNSKKTKVKKQLFYPLSVLNLETDHRDSREIQRVKEAHIVFSAFSIPTDLNKASMTFFLSEFLTKILRDINENNKLFEFLIHSIEILELADKNIANYHLVFILHLTRYLGFFPNLENYEQGDIFDMLNGEFTKKQPLHSHYINRIDSYVLSKLGRITYDNMHLFRFSRQDRINIINRFLEYYRIHLHDFTPMKSLEVLHELF